MATPFVPTPFPLPILLFRGWGRDPVRVRDERVTKLPGCDDCTGVGHDKNLVLVVVVVAWAGPGT